jgi:hypothetical protein
MEKLGFHGKFTEAGEEASQLDDGADALEDAHVSKTDLLWGGGNKIVHNNQRPVRSTLFFMRGHLHG